MYFLECQEKDHKLSISNWITQSPKAGYLFFAKYILLLLIQLTRKKPCQAAIHVVFSF